MEEFSSTRSLLQLTCWDVEALSTLMIIGIIYLKNAMSARLNNRNKKFTSATLFTPYLKENMLSFQWLRMGTARISELPSITLKLASYV